MDLNVTTGNVNLAGVLAYIPGGIVTSDTIPAGPQIGFLSSEAVLRLIGAASDQVARTQFEMLNASIDVTDTVSFENLDDNGTRDYGQPGQ